MVLEFGLINSGLFNTSETLGDGLGADQTQSIIYTDVGVGIYKILNVDETTDLDIVDSTLNKSYTLIGDNLTNLRYIIIRMNGKFNCGSSGTGSARIDLKIEATAPAAVTYFDATIVSASSATGYVDRKIFNEFEYIRTLSAAEKNGLTIKITIDGSTSTDGENNYTNRQIVLIGVA